MKKAIATTAVFAAIVFTFANSPVTAAEYTITWKNNLPVPTGLISCSRTINGVSTTGVDTPIKTGSNLDFGPVRTTPVTETFSYTPPTGCGKIKLRISCAYKDGDITEFMTGNDVVPCRSNVTATINLFTLSVD